MTAKPERYAWKVLLFDNKLTAQVAEKQFPGAATSLSYFPNMVLRLRKAHAACYLCTINSNRRLGGPAAEFRMRLWRNW
jgi:hypothetical protein